MDECGPVAHWKAAILEKKGQAKMRLKWEIESGGEAFVMSREGRAERTAILELLDSNALTSHFQPVFSSKDGSIFGYEALARLLFAENSPFMNIGDLFRKARELDVISSLDVLCREQAIKNASLMEIAERNAYLFINICPETCLDPAHSSGITDGLAEEWRIPKESIILEVTEESAIHNYNAFREALMYYRDRGYKIAIDDFGAGYGGLKMLSIIEPDFVKIDRHFISNIDKASIKANLVDSIVSACHRMGIKVIAEGIETGEELKVVQNMGIEFLQGFYLGRPSATLQPGDTKIPLFPARNGMNRRGEAIFIGDIASAVDTVPPSASVSYVFDRFIKNPELRGLPVVDEDRIVGMFNRIRFLENQVLGRYGYGMHLNSHKKIDQLMDRSFLLVEATTPLEEVAQRIHSRESEFLYDDICVTRSGKYFGTVAISKLLDAITEKSLALARGANPLSGLPGNESIQREISSRLSQGMHFDVCYFDIDHFKPYNDQYGFERGDMVIKSLAESLAELVNGEKDPFHFVGHIGGDDFILITRPQSSLLLSERAVSRFEAKRPEFHGEDYRRGFYVSANRKGEPEQFSLLSLSIGIVSTEVCRIESYAQLASIATEVKKAAKSRNGSSIVRDRRMEG